MIKRISMPISVPMITANDSANVFADFGVSVEMTPIIVPISV